MRVAFAMINCNRRDGSARPVNEVAERLAAAGHEVHLYARKTEDLDLTRVRWFRVAGPGWPEVADFWTYHRLVDGRLRHHDYDILHSIGCNTSRANVVTIQNIQPAKREIMARFAGRERISPPRRFTRWLYDRVTSRAEALLYEKETARRSVLFLPVSRGVEGELRRHYRIGSSPVRIVPNAADTTVFRPPDPAGRAAWRREAGWAEDDFVAVFTGGEWARKGLDLAIAGVAAAGLPRLRLFVAGDDPDRARFQGLASLHGVADRVIFGGFRRDVAAVMGAGDVFLFPSHYEAFSLATIEAAACGLPVLAARINGTEEFIRPGETGDFVDHDPESIAATLRRYATSPQLCRETGERARALVVRDYTWDRVAEMTLAAYTELLHGGKEARSR